MGEPDWLGVLAAVLALMALFMVMGLRTGRGAKINPPPNTPPGPPRRRRY